MARVSTTPSSERFTAEGGTLTNEVPHEGEQASYASELATCTDTNPDVLIAISYPESGSVFLRELVEAGDPPTMILSDGLRSEDIFGELGWEFFAGMIGTSAGAAESEESTAFVTAYEEAYGDLPSHPYLREVYDAVFLIAAAAQAAGANDPASISAELQAVASAPGTEFSGGVEGWQAAVAALEDGQDIDYVGASGPVDLDDNGDVARGRHHDLAGRGGGDRRRRDARHRPHRRRRGHADRRRSGGNARRVALVREPVGAHLPWQPVVQCAIRKPFQIWNGFLLSCT